MKAMVVVFILIMNAGMDCCSPTGSSCSSSAGNNTPPRNTVGSFDGWITDAVTHCYIKGASICLEDSSRCTESSNSGGYMLNPGKQGTFTVVTTHPDYKPDTTKSWVGSYNTRLNIRLTPIGR